MLPELRFSKDFDSFKVEPDHLEVVYGTKTFRFGYAINYQDRKFFIKALDNTLLCFPGMLLQCHNQDVWHGIPVDVTTKFEDMLMFAQFVEKLASVAGYQQSRVVKCDSSESMTSDSGDDDASDDESDDASQDQNLQSRGAVLMFIEERDHPLEISFPGGYFEIAHSRSGTVYRFAYPPGASRTYEIHPKGFGASKTGTVKYLVKNVMLQSPSNQNAGRVFRGRGGGGPAAGVFVDLAEVDVFVELVTASSEAALNGYSLQQAGFQRTN